MKLYFTFFYKPIIQYLQRIIIDLKRNKRRLCVINLHTEVVRLLINNLSMIFQVVEMHLYVSVVSRGGGSLTFPLGGRLELRLPAWLSDLVEKLSVLVLEADRLLALGPLVISSLLTAEIFDWPLLLAGDCGALLEPGVALKLWLFPVGEDSDPARVRLRPVRGAVPSPLAPPPLRLSALSREKQS